MKILNLPKENENILNIFYEKFYYKYYINSVCSLGFAERNIKGN